MTLGAVTPNEVSELRHRFADDQAERPASYGDRRSGVDTVSFAYRPRRDDVLPALLRCQHRPGPAGSLILNERLPGGARVIVYPTYDHYAVEGRLGALLAGDEQDHSLAPTAALQDASAGVQKALGDLLGMTVRDPDEIRRLDLASEYVPDSPSQGRAFLRALAYLDLPRRRVEAIRKGGAVETVYAKTPKRGAVDLRAYCKATEAATGPLGSRVRLEKQHRPQKRARMTPQNTAHGADLRALYASVLDPWASEGRELVVADVDGVAATLMGRVERGELSIREAERLIGSAVVARNFGKVFYSRPTGYRRLAALRDNGLVLAERREDDGMGAVPVGAIVRELRDAFDAS